MLVTVISILYADFVWDKEINSREIGAAFNGHLNMLFSYKWSTKNFDNSIYSAEDYNNIILSASLVDFNLCYSTV